MSFTGSVPRLRVTRHTVSPIARVGGDEDSLAQATLLANFKRPSPYPDSETSEDESREIEVAGTSTRLLSASLPPPDSSTHSGDTTHRLRALLNRIDNSSRNPTEPRIIMPPTPSEPESDFDLRPAQVARASIKDLFQNAMRDPGDSTPNSSPISNAERQPFPFFPFFLSYLSNIYTVRERLKDNERQHQHELERSWNRPHSRNLQSTPHLHERPHHSHIPRSGSSSDHSHEDTHHKLHTLSVRDRPRSISPASSASSRSHREQPLEDEHVVEQEREPNRNSPRPKSGQYPHHAYSGTHHHLSGSPSPEPSASSSPDICSEPQTKDTYHRTGSSSSTSISDQQSRLPSDPLKRHRRTTTELSESMGAFPRQNGLLPMLKASDDSNASLFGSYHSHSVISFMFN